MKVVRSIIVAVLFILLSSMAASCPIETYASA